MANQDKYAHSLLEILAIHRKNVADYERERSIGFNASLNRRLEDERREIRKIKKQLRDIGVKVAENPLDGDSPKLHTTGKYENETQSQRPRNQKRNTRSQKNKDEPPPSFMWILLLFVVGIGAATIVSIVVDDIFKIAIVFIFTLLLLGVILPFIALRSGFLSQSKWFQSYIATLEKIPLLNEILKIFHKK